MSGASPEVVDVVVVGTGFSGLGMAIALLREERAAGRRSFVVLEKAGGVGGTWRENRYPGCACDVPSHLYSFSFAPHAGWTRSFAPQPEILAYLERCADDFGVRPHLRFGQEVVEARFDDVRARWTVTTKQGDTFSCRHLVSGVGGLHRPRVPDLPGRDGYAGPQFHSAEWRDDVDLAGKRVAVIGTGASAIQIVPAIAPKVSHLTLFQRTPPWLLPRNDQAVPGWLRALYEKAPALLGLERRRIYWALEWHALGFFREPRILALAERLSLRHLRRQVKDPALRERLTPQYRVGCKRVLLSDDFYHALSRPNVDLVADAVAAVDAAGVTTAAGVHHDVDVIIWCTGFHATDPLAHLKVVGRGGVDLNAGAWKDGIEAYRGTLVSGFPNLYLLVGPNTGLGHSSMVLMIEAQIRYVMEHLRLLDEQKKDFVDVRPAAQAAWNAKVQTRLARSVWSTGCKSWYLDARGRNPVLWPGFTFEFEQALGAVAEGDVELGAARAPAGGGR